MSRRKVREIGPFAMLPDEVLRSDACRTLPHAAYRVLVILAAQYFGKNNGSLTLTRRTAAQYGIGNPYTLDASLRELEGRNLIVRTRPGYRGPPPRSSMFAITWRAIDEPKEHDRHDVRPTLKPSNAWAEWKATKKTPHYSGGKRRVTMYPRATRSSSPGIHREHEMSSPGIHAAPLSPVAQGYGSDISGGEGASASARKAAAWGR